jgi:hypothetical protein
MLDWQVGTCRRVYLHLFDIKLTIKHKYDTIATMNSLGPESDPTRQELKRFERMHVANLVTMIGFTAVTALGIYNTYEAHEEAVRADATAEAVKQQGDHEQAAEWQEYADHMESERNKEASQLVLPGILLASGTIGSVNTGRNIRRLEEEIAQQQQPPEQPSAK